MKLNQQQLTAVTCPSHRVLCISGAGSGKTRVFVERIKWLIAQGADPRSIVALTFTTQAAAEIQKRLEFRKPLVTAPDETAVAWSNFSPQLGFCGTLHSYLLRILQQHGHLIGLASRLTVLDDAETEALLVKVVSDLNYKGTRKSVDEAVAKGFQLYKVRPRNLPWKPAELVAYEMCFRLITTGCLTFNMILDLGLELIRHMGPELAHFQHLACDEFQDANALDAQIYDALPVKTRFFVGDERQSIYHFRGGDVNVIRSESQRPDTTILQLAQNYRSGSAIVDAANSLQPNHTPMVSATGTMGNVTITGYDCAAEESAIVTASVKREIAAGTPANECAVLCRTNALAASFRAMLKANDIPVRERKQADNPLDWAIARAFVALLTNPESDRLAARFLEMKLGPEKAAQMQREAVADYTTINEKFLHIANVQPQDVTSAMLAAGLGRESIGRVRALVEQLDGGATMLELQGALIELDEENAEETDGVTVCTIHASKGKEWECVWLPAWEEGVFPSARELAEDGGAEAQRLAYVAVTRAKSLCSISYAKLRTMEWKGVEHHSPSRFVARLAA